MALADTEARRAYNRKWYAANKGKVKERSRQWAQINREARRTIYRRNSLRDNFGMTLPDYDALLEKQGFKCAICASPSSKRNDGKVFCVDHCHETGRIRGLLCHPCNVALGLLGDDPHRLQCGITYLNGGW